jgi:fucose 4-O-acetylase-like acetyltransferase
MPLFFFLSGMFIECSLTRGAAAFLSSRVKTLIYPYVLWYALQGSMNFSLSGVANKHLVFSDLIPGLLTRPYGQFWFLHALICLVLLYGMARRFRVPIAGITLGSCGAYLFSQHAGTGTPAVVQAVLSNSLYFSLGAQFSPRVLSYAARFNNAALALALSACSAVALTVVVGAPVSMWSPLVLPALGITATIGLALFLQEAGRLAWLRVLGFLSLPIYLAHVFGASGARIILHKVFGIEQVWLHVVAGVSAGMMIPILFVKLAEWTEMPLFRWGGQTRAESVRSVVQDRPSLTSITSN